MAVNNQIESQKLEKNWALRHLIKFSMQPPSI